MTASRILSLTKEDQRVDISDNERQGSSDAHDAASLPGGSRNRLPRSASPTGSSQGHMTTGAMQRQLRTGKAPIKSLEPPQPPEPFKAANEGDRQHEQPQNMAKNNVQIKYWPAVLTLLLPLVLIELLVLQFRHATPMSICAMPGFGLLCSAPVALKTEPYEPRYEYASGPPQWADFPRLVAMQEKTLGALLNETVNGFSLSLQVKKTEMDATDFATLVGVSDLTSGDRLADMLAQFASDASETARLLQRFGAQASSTVNNVIAINECAMHTIQSAQDRAGSLSTNLHVFLPFLRHSHLSDDLERTLTKAFSSSMDVLENDISRLQLQASGVMARLNRLEAHLRSIHELVSREKKDNNDARDELLQLLWTKFCSNARTLRNMTIQCALLDRVDTYRSRAFDSVGTTIQTLDAHQADMEELRRRVATPALVGDSIPIEVHVRSIDAGLERLRERSERAEAQRIRALQRNLNADSQ